MLSMWFCEVLQLCENVIEQKRYGRPVHFKMEIASSKGNTVNVLMFKKSMKFFTSMRLFHNDQNQRRVVRNKEEQPYLKMG